MALELGFDTVRAGAAFVPFVLLQDEAGELQPKWCVDATPEAAVDRARHTAATSTCVRYAVTRHDEIPDREGIKRAAVIAEVGDREHEAALRMAQPYRPYLSPTQRAEPIGTPIMLGDTVNVLRGATTTPGPEPAFVVLCPACSRKNRVSLRRVREKLPTCGACRKSLLG